MFLGLLKAMHRLLGQVYTADVQLTENLVANQLEKPGGTGGEDTADPAIAVGWGFWGSSWLLLKPAWRKT